MKIASSNSSASSSGLAQPSIAVPSILRATDKSSRHFSLTASVVVEAGKDACFFCISLLDFSSFIFTGESGESLSFLESMSSLFLSFLSSFFLELLGVPESFPSLLTAFGEF